MATFSKRRWRWWIYIPLAFVLLLAVIVLSGYLFVSCSLPVTEGERTLSGLSSEVTVYRDDRGVPHIEATNYHDLFFAQGYVTAQDRLWQMDLSRRAAAGRLSEVLNPSLLGTDKFLRTLLLRRSAEKSQEAHSPFAKEVLTAYSKGVNAFIEEAKEENTLPLEFLLLGYEPEPWSIVDSISIGKLMAFDLGGNYRGEVARYLLREKVGDTLAKQLFPIYPDNGITIMRYGATQANYLPKQETTLPEQPNIDLQGLLKTAIWPNPSNGSNNWVVSGKKTASGKPLLANDPHLRLSTPAIWYQTHLVLQNETESMNVIGVIFPGAPGIVIGHNETMAWGVTNTGPDVQDLFVERRNEKNPYQFEYEGNWEDATVYKETIKVKGQEAVPFEVVVTRHGPIMSEVLGTEGLRPKEALALQWTAHRSTLELEAVLMFGKSSTVEEFRKALQKFQVPTQNFVFASVDGTIGYRAAGLIPIRKKGDGVVPVPGWSGEYEWEGFIPFEEMPEVINPEEGFIATANNKVVDGAYPYFITSSWAPPYRAMRITEVLEKGEKLTPQDMQALQTDYTNLQARLLLPVFLKSLEKNTLKESENVAKSLLQNWDFVESTDQAAPLLFQLWRKNFVTLLYKPTLGEELFALMGENKNVTDDMIIRAAQGDENDWIRTAGGLDILVLESFRNALKEGVSLQGDDVSAWRWGEFHQIGPAHTIGRQVKVLGWLLNPKTYPVGGSGETVAAMHFNKTTGEVGHSAPWRQVVDLADPAGNSFDIVTPGQSGHFLSDWYADQANPHASGELFLQQMKKERYQTGDKLVLKP